MKIYVICQQSCPLPPFFGGSLGIQHVGKQFISKVLHQRERREEIQLRRWNFFDIEGSFFSQQQTRTHTNAENQLFCVATILYTTWNLNGDYLTLTFKRQRAWETRSKPYPGPFCHGSQAVKVLTRVSSLLGVCDNILSVILQRRVVTPCGCDTNLQTRHEMLDWEKHVMPR